MTQIFEIPSNPVPLIDSAHRSAPNSGIAARDLGSILITACLLMIVPSHAHTDEIASGSASVAADKLAIDDEDPDADAADDGSSALRDTFEVYNLEEIEPISAKEEEALLGNWGDTDAEDGD